MPLAQKDREGFRCPELAQVTLKNRLRVCGNLHDSKPRCVRGYKIADAAAVPSIALPVALRLASAAFAAAHSTIRLLWTTAPHSAADMHSETQAQLPCS